jgi:hypothetical protein
MLFAMPTRGGYLIPCNCSGIQGMQIKLNIKICPQVMDLYDNGHTET